MRAHRITVAKLTTWQDVLAQPELVSTDEEYPDGGLVHEFADESVWGSDPATIYELKCSGDYE